MKKLIIYISFFFLLWWINQSFSNSTLSYTSSSGIKECNGQSRNDDSWLKEIPNPNNLNAPSSWTVSCVTHWYWFSTWSSRKNKWSHYACPNNEYASEIQWRSSNTQYRIKCKSRDDIAPTIWDITNNISTNLLSNNNYNYNFSISDNGGSPITEILGYYENSNDELTKADFSCNSSPCSVNWDISEVDNFRETNGSRQYSFTITEICDESWNCWNWTQTYNHNVYANHSITTSIDSIDLTSSNIADGTSYPLTIILKDIYGNAIIPASWIWRTIDFNFDVTNTSDLNQYTQGKTDAIFLDIPSNSLFSDRLTSNSNFDSQPSSDWDYTFNFKVYSPVWENEYDFNINSINYDINDFTFWNLDSQSISSNISFDFDPLFTTEYTWYLKDDGFRVWQYQTWAIYINKEKPTTTSNPNTYIEFWKYYDPDHLEHPNLDMTYEGGTTINEWNNWISNTPYTLFDNSTWNKEIVTFISQSGSLSTSDNAYLSTHISYTIDWKSVVLNSDVLWLTHYYWDSDNWDVSINWIKIEWKTHSKDSQELQEWMEWEDSNYQILWNIDRASIAKDVRKTAYNIINSATPDNWVSQITNLDFSNNNDWLRLNNDNLLYFWELDWDKVEISLSDINFSWKKTILIHGWNLYIKSNIVSSNLSEDILGIIVMQDQNLKWWNIYVEKDVTRIDAVMYADKVLATSDNTYINNSSDSDKIISWSYLNTQLYINGSIFSNNTLWWSTNGTCPYFIKDEECTPEESQKYDLNYLRRWYNDKYDNSYGDYPVIIKYNPVIQITPPPLFKLE